MSDDNDTTINEAFPTIGIEFPSNIKYLFSYPLVGTSFGTLEESSAVLSQSQSKSYLIIVVSSLLNIYALTYNPRSESPNVKHCGNIGDQLNGAKPSISMEAPLKVISETSTKVSHGSSLHSSPLPSIKGKPKPPTIISKDMKWKIRFTCASCLPSASLLIFGLSNGWTIVYSYKDDRIVKIVSLQGLNDASMPSGPYQDTASSSSAVSSYHMPKSIRTSPSVTSVASFVSQDGTSMLLIGYSSGTLVSIDVAAPTPFDLLFRLRPFSSSVISMYPIQKFSEASVMAALKLGVGNEKHSRAMGDSSTKLPYTSIDSVGYVVVASSMRLCIIPMSEGRVVSTFAPQQGTIGCFSIVPQVDKKEIAPVSSAFLTSVATESTPTVTKTGDRVKKLSSTSLGVDTCSTQSLYDSAMTVVIGHTNGNLTLCKMFHCHIGSCEYTPPHTRLGGRVTSIESCVSYMNDQEYAIIMSVTDTDVAPLVHRMCIRLKSVGDWDIQGKTTEIDRGLRSREKVWGKRQHFVPFSAVSASVPTVSSLFPLPSLRSIPLSPSTIGPAPSVFIYSSLNNVSLVRGVGEDISERGVDKNSTGHRNQREKERKGSTIDLKARDGLRHEGSDLSARKKVLPTVQKNMALEESIDEAIDTTHIHKTPSTPISQSLILDTIPSLQPPDEATPTSEEKKDLDLVEIPKYESPPDISSYVQPAGTFPPTPHFAPGSKLPDNIPADSVLSATNTSITPSKKQSKVEAVSHALTQLLETKADDVSDRQSFYRGIRGHRTTDLSDIAFSPFVVPGDSRRMSYLRESEGRVLLSPKESAYSSFYAQGKYPTFSPNYKPLNQPVRSSNPFRRSSFLDSNVHIPPSAIAHIFLKDSQASFNSTNLQRVSRYRFQSQDDAHREYQLALSALMSHQTQALKRMQNKRLKRKMAALGLELGTIGSPSKVRRIMEERERRDKTRIQVRGGDHGQGLQVLVSPSKSPRKIRDTPSIKPSKSYSLPSPTIISMDNEEKTKASKLKKQLDREEEDISVVEPSDVKGSWKSTDPSAFPFPFDSIDGFNPKDPSSLPLLSSPALLSLFSSYSHQPSSALSPRGMLFRQRPGSRRAQFKQKAQMRRLVDKMKYLNAMYMINHSHYGHRGIAKDIYGRPQKSSGLNNAHSQSQLSSESSSSVHSGSSGIFSIFAQGLAPGYKPFSNYSNPNAAERSRMDVLNGPRHDIRGSQRSAEDESFEMVGSSGKDSSSELKRKSTPGGMYGRHSSGAFPLSHQPSLLSQSEEGSSTNEQEPDWMLNGMHVPKDLVKGLSLDWKQDDFEFLLLPSHPHMRVRESKMPLWARVALANRDKDPDAALDADFESLASAAALQGDINAESEKLFHQFRSLMVRMGSRADVPDDYYDTSASGSERMGDGKRTMTKHKSKGWVGRFGGWGGREEEWRMKWRSMLQQSIVEGKIDPTKITDLMKQMRREESELRLQRKLSQKRLRGGEQTGSGDDSDQIDEYDLDIEGLSEDDGQPIVTPRKGVSFAMFDVVHRYTPPPGSVMSSLDSDVSLSDPSSISDDLSAEGGYSDEDYGNQVDKDLIAKYSQMVDLNDLLNDDETKFFNLKGDDELAVSPPRFSDEEDRMSYSDPLSCIGGCGSEDEEDDELWQKQKEIQRQLREEMYRATADMIEGWEPPSDRRDIKKIDNNLISNSEHSYDSYDEYGSSDVPSHQNIGNDIKNHPSPISSPKKHRHESNHRKPSSKNESASQADSNIGSSHEESDVSCSNEESHSKIEDRGIKSDRKPKITEDRADDQSEYEYYSEEEDSSFDRDHGKRRYIRPGDEEWESIDEETLELLEESEEIFESGTNSDEFSFTSIDRSSPSRDHGKRRYIRPGDEEWESIDEETLELLEESEEIFESGTNSDEFSFTSIDRSSPSRSDESMVSRMLRIQRNNIRRKERGSSDSFAMDNSDNKFSSRDDDLLADLDEEIRMRANGELVSDEESSSPVRFLSKTQIGPDTGLIGMFENSLSEKDEIRFYNRSVSPRPGSEDPPTGSSDGFMLSEKSDLPSFPDLYDPNAPRPASPGTRSKQRFEEIQRMKDEKYELMRDVCEFSSIPESQLGEIQFYNLDISDPYSDEMSLLPGSMTGSDIYSNHNCLDLELSDPPPWVGEGSEYDLLSFSDDEGSSARERDIERQTALGHLIQGDAKPSRSSKNLLKTLLGQSDDDDDKNDSDVSSSTARRSKQDSVLDTDKDADLLHQYNDLFDRNDELSSEYEYEYEEITASVSEMGNKSPTQNNSDADESPVRKHRRKHKTRRKKRVKNKAKSKEKAAKSKSMIPPLPKWLVLIIVKGKRKIESKKWRGYDLLSFSDDEGSSARERDIERQTALGHLIQGDAKPSRSSKNLLKTLLGQSDDDDDKNDSDVSSSTARRSKQDSVLDTDKDADLLHQYNDLFDRNDELSSEYEYEYEEITASVSEMGNKSPTQNNSDADESPVRKHRRKHKTRRKKRVKNKAKSKEKAAKSKSMIPPLPKWLVLIIVKGKRKIESKKWRGVSQEKWHKFVVRKSGRSWSINSRNRKVREEKRWRKIEENKKTRDENPDMVVSGIELLGGKGFPSIVPIDSSLCGLISRFNRYKLQQKTNQIEMDFIPDNKKLVNKHQAKIMSRLEQFSLSGCDSVHDEDPMVANIPCLFPTVFTTHSVPLGSRVPSAIKRLLNDNSSLPSVFVSPFTTFRLEPLLFHAHTLEPPSYLTRTQYHEYKKMENDGFSVMTVGERRELKKGTVTGLGGIDPKPSTAAVSRKSSKWNAFRQGLGTSGNSSFDSDNMPSSRSTITSRSSTSRAGLEPSTSKSSASSLLRIVETPSSISHIFDHHSFLDNNVLRLGRVTRKCLSLDIGSDHISSDSLLQHSPVFFNGIGVDGTLDESGHNVAGRERVPLGSRMHSRRGSDGGIFCQFLVEQVIFEERERKERKQEKVLGMNAVPMNNGYEHEEKEPNDQLTSFQKIPEPFLSSEELDKNLLPLPVVASYPLDTLFGILADHSHDEKDEDSDETSTTSVTMSQEVHLAAPSYNAHSFQDQDNPLSSRDEKSLRAVISSARPSGVDDLPTQNAGQVPLAPILKLRLELTLMYDEHIFDEVIAKKVFKVIAKNPGPPVKKNLPITGRGVTFVKDRSSTSRPQIIEKEELWTHVINLSFYRIVQERSNPISNYIPFIPLRNRNQNGSSDSMDPSRRRSSVSRPSNDLFSKLSENRIGIEEPILVCVGDFSDSPPSPASFPCIPHVCRIERGQIGFVDMIARETWMSDPGICLMNPLKEIVSEVVNNVLVKRKRKKAELEDIGIPDGPNAPLVLIEEEKDMESISEEETKKSVDHDSNNRDINEDKMDSKRDGTTSKVHSFNLSIPVPSSSHLIAERNMSARKEGHRTTSRAAFKRIIGFPVDDIQASSSDNIRSVSEVVKQMLRSPEELDANSVESYLEFTSSEHMQMLISLIEKLQGMTWRDVWAIGQQVEQQTSQKGIKRTDISRSARTKSGSSQLQRDFSKFQEWEKMSEGILVLPPQISLSGQPEAPLFLLQVTFLLFLSKFVEAQYSLPNRGMFLFEDSKFSSSFSSIYSLDSSIPFNGPLLLGMPSLETINASTSKLILSQIRVESVVSSFRKKLEEQARRFEVERLRARSRYLLSKCGYLNDKEFGYLMTSYKWMIRSVFSTISLRKHLFLSQEREIQLQQKAQKEGHVLPQIFSQRSVDKLSLQIAALWQLPSFLFICECITGNGRSGNGGSIPDTSELKKKRNEEWRIQMAFDAKHGSARKDTDKIPPQSLASPSGLPDRRASEADIVSLQESTPRTLCKTLREKEIDRITARMGCLLTIQNDYLTSQAEVPLASSLASFSPSSIPIHTSHALTFLGLVVRGARQFGERGTISPLDLAVANGYTVPQDHQEMDAKKRKEAKKRRKERKKILKMKNGPKSSSSKPTTKKEFSCPVNPSIDSYVLTVITEDDSQDDGEGTKTAEKGETSKGEDSDKHSEEDEEEEEEEEEDEINQDLISEDKNNSDDLIDNINSPLESESSDFVDKTKKKPRVPTIPLPPSLPLGSVRPRAMSVLIQGSISKRTTPSQNLFPSEKYKYSPPPPPKHHLLSSSYMSLVKRTHDLMLCELELRIFLAKVLAENVRQHIHKAPADLEYVPIEDDKENDLVKPSDQQSHKPLSKELVNALETKKSRKSKRRISWKFSGTVNRQSRSHSRSGSVTSVTSDTNEPKPKMTPVYSSIDFIFPKTLPSMEENFVEFCVSKISENQHRQLYYLPFRYGTSITGTMNMSTMEHEEIDELDDIYNEEKYDKEKKRFQGKNMVELEEEIAWAAWEEKKRKRSERLSARKRRKSVDSSPRSPHSPSSSSNSNIPLSPSISPAQVDDLPHIPLLVQTSPQGVEEIAPLPLAAEFDDGLGDDPMLTPPSKIPSISTLPFDVQQKRIIGDAMANGRMGAFSAYLDDFRLHHSSILLNKIILEEMRAEERKAEEEMELKILQSVTKAAKVGINPLLISQGLFVTQGIDITDIEKEQTTSIDDLNLGGYSLVISDSPVEMGEENEEPETPRNTNPKSSEITVLSEFTPNVSALLHDISTNPLDDTLTDGTPCHSRTVFGTEESFFSGKTERDVDELSLLATPIVLSAGGILSGVGTECRANRKAFKDVDEFVAKASDSGYRLDPSHPLFHNDGHVFVKLEQAELQRKRQEEERLLLELEAQKEKDRFKQSLQLSSASLSSIELPISRDILSARVVSKSKNIGDKNSLISMSASLAIKSSRGPSESVKSTPRLDLTSTTPVRVKARTSSSSKFINGLSGEKVSVHRGTFGERTTPLRGLSMKDLLDPITPSKPIGSEKTDNAIISDGIDHKTPKVLDNGTDQSISGHKSPRDDAIDSGSFVTQPSFGFSLRTSKRSHARKLQSLRSRTQSIRNQVGRFGRKVREMSDVIGGDPMSRKSSTIEKPSIAKHGRSSSALSTSSSVSEASKRAKSKLELGPKKQMAAIEDGIRKKLTQDPLQGRYQYLLDNKDRSSIILAGSTRQDGVHSSLATYKREKAPSIDALGMSRRTKPSGPPGLLLRNLTPFQFISEANDLVDMIPFRSSTTKFSSKAIKEEDVKSICQFIVNCPFHDMYAILLRTKGADIFTDKKIQKSVWIKDSAETIVILVGKRHSPNFIASCGLFGEMLFLYIANLGLSTCYTISTKFDLLSVQRALYMFNSDEDIIVTCMPVGYSRDTAAVGNLDISSSSAPITLRRPNPLAGRRVLDDMLHPDSVSPSKWGSHTKFLLILARKAPSYKNLQPYFFKVSHMTVPLYSTASARETYGDGMEPISIIELYVKLELHKTLVKKSSKPVAKGSVLPDPRLDAGICASHMLLGACTFPEGVLKEIEMGDGIIEPLLRIVVREK
ncbi:hypothetical protein ADUPG1_008497 [Aduncisulcus paluster]|uniref:Putative nitroreductase TM1586 domain-containing protein n=1 Tax=Aduncisulcus paluster TaxID=2918883 RepID=A0ABQ5KS79_9EUKA|nr:hypothetical protein ADUPG1_008497 [Aduncisulcus paluster]